MKKEEKIEQKIAYRVSKVSIIVNILLSILKFVAGIFANSGAMISDAVHSLSDVLSTFVVILGIHISGKESDSKHQYGHEKLECVVAIVLAIILAITGIGIGYSGYEKIKMGLNGGELQVPGALALIAAIISIGIKEWMYWYTRNNAKKINSSSLMADAWHHRSDAMSSIGSFIGIGGAMIGFKILDPIAALIIAIIILKVAYDISKDSFQKMVDVSCDETVILEIQKLIEKENEILRIDSLKTRIFGSKFYVDLEIALDENLSLKDAHEIAERIHNKVENSFPNAKHCMVHVNPA